MPFAFLSFVLAYWVYKYVILYVYQTRHDTAGAMWRIVMNCMFISMVIFQVYMIGCLRVRISNFVDHPDQIDKAMPVVYLLCPVPLITSVVGIGLHFWMGPKVDYMQSIPDADRYAAAKEGEARFEETLGDRFLHPIFSQPLPTPMVDKRVRRLLPQVYRGRTSVLADPEAVAKGQFDVAPVRYAQSIATASTVCGSDMMDLESVMDERDQRDFDGAASPTPQRYQAAGTAGAFRRGPSGLTRRYSTSSSATSSDAVEMAAMGMAKDGTLQASSSRANLLGYAQPPASHANSMEMGDYDGNATMVGRSASPDTGLLAPNVAGWVARTQTSDAYDAAVLYGDGAMHRQATHPGGTAAAYGDFGGHAAPGPWIGERQRAAGAIRTQPSTGGIAWQLPESDDDAPPGPPAPQRNLPWRS
ncbi:hypothetical protein H4R19_005919 [Coemansia spiralis]|nr:hypothetical protein H4R19_005919 [Coemansia spiralis]